MDTNSNIPAEKKVVSVEILHLDKLGYGPQGKHTRREWRKECLENLLAGKHVFKAWQENLQILIKPNPYAYKVDFCCNTLLDDGEVKLYECLDNASYTLDFVGNYFNNLLAADFVFMHRTNFNNSVFNSSTNFSSTIFNKELEFKNVNFKSYIFFWNAKFNEAVNFDCAVFTGMADFRSVEFTGEAHFNNAVFHYVSFFYYSIFHDFALFRGVLFKSGVSFLKVTFKSGCNFDNYNTVESTQTSKFDGMANFSSAVFSGVGHFERVHFENLIPDFLGVDNATTRLEFSDDACFNEKDTSEEAIKRIGKLKRLADEQGQTDQALMFNKFELNAKRAQARIKTKSLNAVQKLGNSDFWFANATALYDIFSSYGRSFTKPLKYYLGLLLVVYILALGNAVVNSPKDCKAENLRMLSDLWRDDTPCDISKTNPDDKTRLNGYRAAAEYTVYRAAGILDFSDNGKGTDAVARRLFGQSYEPGWMRFIGLIKAIASTALLFLAALGLRNKYRIK